MLVHEDKGLEAAAEAGEFDVIVPAEIYLVPDSEPRITAYNCVWNICEDYENRNGGDLLDKTALSELCEKIAPIICRMGYEIDLKGSRVINEYRIGDVTDKLKKNAVDAEIVRSPSEIEDLECSLLHRPEPDEDCEEDVCAVVIKDGIICSVAGVNDYSDDDSLEIFVETSPEYRGRGYGSSAVAALAIYLVELGYTVAYNCAEDNLGSVRIAERLGMKSAGKRFSAICYAAD